MKTFTIHYTRKLDVGSDATNRETVGNVRPAPRQPRFSGHRVGGTSDETTRHPTSHLSQMRQYCPDNGYQQCAISQQGLDHTLVSWSMKDDHEADESTDRQEAGGESTLFSEITARR